MSLAAVAAAQPAPPHVRPADSEVRFGGAGGPRSVRLVADTGWVPSAAVLIDVRRGAQRLTSDRTSFTAQLAQLGDAAFVDLDLVGAPTPGTYQLTVAITATSKAADGQTTSDRGEHVITATVASPTLTTSPAIHVDIIDGIWGGTTVRTTPMVVAESSRKAAAGNLSLRQILPATHGGKPSRGHLAVELPATLAAAGLVYGTLTVDRAFALGDSTASLELTADHLEQPVTIPVDVRHRRTSAWVFWLFLVGSAVGWVVRTWAKRTIDLEAARAAAATLVNALAAAAARSLPEEAKAASDHVATLRAAHDDRDALTAATTKAREWLTQLATTHRTQLDGLRTKLTARAALLALRALPTSVSGALDAMRDDVDAGESALVAADAREAAAVVTRIDRRIDVARVALEEQATLLADQVTRLGQSQASAPKEARSYLGAVAALSTSLLALRTKADPVTELTDGATAFGSAWQQLQGAATALAGFGDAARETLSKDPAAGAAIARAATVALDHDAVIAASQLRGMIVAVRALVAELARAVPAAVEQVKAGELLAALETIDASSTKPAVPIQDGGGRESFVAHDLAGPRAIAPIELASVGAAATVADPLPSKRDWRGWAALIARQVVALAILPTVAWWLYADAFTGTGREMLVLGATGFLTDVSFETALDWLGKLKHA